MYYYYIREKLGKWAQKTEVGCRCPRTEVVQKTNRGASLHYLTSDKIHYVNHNIICCYTMLC